MSPHVTEVDSLVRLRSLARSPPILIDFTATWCGPCKAIAPVYERLAQQYAGRIQSVKVDVDRARDVAAYYGVSAMPTFVVLDSATMTTGGEGRKVDEMKGANPSGLEALFKKHALSVASAGTGAGSTAAADKGLEGFSSLNGSIDMAQIQCLNEDSSHTIRDMLKASSGTGTGTGNDSSSTPYLESDADEQLLLQLPMQQSTKLRAVRFTTRASTIGQAPKVIKLFVNQSATMGFDDAESLEPAQEIELTEPQALGQEPIQLRLVRFVSVNQLSIFVVSNQANEDTTRIDKLELIGLENAGTDMSALRKGEDDHDH